MAERPAPAFLAGGGSLGALIHRRDWSTTPLGPLASWSPTLRTTIGLILRSPVPIVTLWGVDGIMIYNDAYAAFAGDRHPGLLGSKVREGWDEIADFNDNVMRVGLAGGTLAYRDQELTLDRRGRPEQVWMDLDYSPILDEGGEPVGVVAIVVETTGKVRAERDLRTSEEQFRVFAQAAPNQVWATRPDGTLYWFNDQILAYAGQQPATGAGAAAWAGLVHPEDLDGAHRAWCRALATGTVLDTEFRMRRTDGAYRWFLVRAEPIRAEDETITRWVGTNTDIDDTKRQAAELARLNETLEQEVEARTRDRDRIWRLSTDIMLVARFDGRIVAVNPAWTALLGWSEQELVGRSFMELVHPDDSPSTTGARGDLSGGAVVPRFENRYRHRDGSYRWLSWTAVPDAEFIHAVGRDTTAERAQAEALAQAEEALRQSQKMEAVGQLTGGLAHDFNNLLTGISGSLDLLQKRVAQGRLGDLDRYLVAAQGASKRAAALTHRLLAFSRRQTLDPKPTDVRKLVLGMADLIRRTVGPQIAVETVDTPDLWATLVDPPQLENALLNLCINARDAMPDGGRITIETANRWMDERTARECDMEPGPYLSLHVRDTGAGMPPEVVARAFDPFFTTKPLGQGTGLGLSMIYGFVRQSGGQVRILSEVGRGTTVCIDLPRHLGPAEGQAVEQARNAMERAGTGETVLVVDDEPSVRMLIGDVLQDLGYAAREAEDGATGLQILRSGAPIDLLVTDVGLPGGMNGRQVADAARALRPGLKVLFITGYAENAAVGNGHLEPGMAVMTKPFAMDDLAAKIRGLIAG